jgi:hypothetical protein
MASETLAILTPYVDNLRVFHLNNQLHALNVERSNLAFETKISSSCCIVRVTVTTISDKHWSSVTARRHAHQQDT